MAVIRGIDESLDNNILNFKKQLELQVGKEISYIIASKLYAEIINNNIYIKNVEFHKGKQKKDRKIIFNIEMKDE